MMKWISVLLLVTPAIAIAEAEPEFHLCSPYVQKSMIGEQTEFGWPVFVKLTELGTKSFEAFTEANSGRMIRIVVGRHEFSRAIVWVPIPSGNLPGTFSSQEIATAWQRTLASELPATPCGVWN